MNSRVSVSTLFLANGFIIGSWAVKIPEFAKRLHLSEGDMGLMIAVFGLGSLIIMPLTGIAIARFGFASVTKLLSLMATLALVWVTLAPSTLLAACALFAFGGVIAGQDVAMNAVAVDVERTRAKPIMSSCHGFWSLGGLIGAFSSGYLIENFGLMVHLAFVTSMCLAAVVPAVLGLPKEVSVSLEQKLAIRLPRTLLPYLIGIVALCAAMPEGAVIDWSALYLQEELGASTIVAAVAFGAFSATMALMRFFGDAVRSRLGAVRTMQVCGAVASAGLLIAGMAPSVEMALLGFLVAGLGMSNLVPIAFSAAGNVPGLAPGISLSVATTIGYSGVLVAPAAFGYMAQWASFSVVFTALGAVMLLVIALSPITRYADRQSATDNKPNH